MRAVGDHTTSPAAPTLRLIQNAGSEAHAVAQVERPLLARVCAGEPLVLTGDEADFIDLLNQGVSHELILLDPGMDPDDVRPAEYVLEYYVHRYGAQRQADGDRAEGLATDYGRYVIPFLVEVAWSLPEDGRGMAALRLTHAERLPHLLAGEQALPAATVAADLLRTRLGRPRGSRCLHLELEDAAHVVHGGETALASALHAGHVETVRDTRTGRSLVRPLDLRVAGLLIEPEGVHGLARSTADNVLRSLTLAFARAADHGSRHRPTFKLKALEPLRDLRQRPVTPPAIYRSVGEVAAVAARMPPIGQLGLWMERLLGIRISEGYGPRVSDYSRDADDQAWLKIHAQGGLRSMERDPATGRLLPVDDKSSTKTAAGERRIPVPAQLATLIEAFITAFHTDPETGHIDADARLVPGLQKDDVSGQSTYRAWLAAAQHGSAEPFEPHLMRKSLITDLKNAGVPERLCHAFAGHEFDSATIQDKHYDLGPAAEDLVSVADTLEGLIDDAIPGGVLAAATSLRHSFGRATRTAAKRAWVDAHLAEAGLYEVDEDPELGLRLDVARVAVMIGCSESHTRRLMNSQTIPSHVLARGAKKIRYSYAADVERHIAGRGTSLKAVAEGLGCTYSQAYTAATETGLLDGHPRGTLIVLDDDEVRRLTEEMTSRSAAEFDAITLADAAASLELSLVDVETLVKQDALTLVEVPGAKRLRHVSIRSVEAFRAQHPATKGEVGPDEPTGAFMATARLMGISRPSLGVLVRTRQVRAVTRGRQQRIVLGDALAWLESNSRPAQAQAVRDLLSDRSR